MKKISNISVKKKLLTVVLLITFLFCALIVRLFYIQIISSAELRGKAIYQWARDLPLKADRGLITDTNGVTLADNVSAYNLYVRPNSLGDKTNTASVIAGILGEDFNKVYEKVSKTGTSEVTVARSLSKNQMIAIEASNLKGVYFSKVSARYYPYGNFLTQVLGFTNADNQGQTGLEAYYNQHLTGVDGQILTETDLVGKELDGSTVSFIRSIDGMNVQTTIDYQIQYFAEKAVSQATMKYDAESATCLIMNPKTGEIYAMAQSPSFDLNDVPRDNLEELFENSKNKLVTGVYEPGSTFKILTSAIGLEEDPSFASRHYYCPGYKIVDGQRIKCWKTLGHGSQTFEEGVANSCNIVFMEIATQLGANKMYNYFKKFGLMEKTGIDVTGESNSILLKQENVKNVDIARIGFGQAIAITPIQLARAASSVINGGYMVEPYLVSGITDTNGRLVYQKKPVQGNRVISASTSTAMRGYLENVVENGGGKNAYVAGYSIGGKTGTAQKYSETGGIAQGKYISSFLGFTSADDPEYLVLMIVDEPKGYEYYGSLVAAPFVKEIFENLFAYKNMKPLYDAGEVETFIMPDLTSMTISEAFAELRKLGVNYEYDGSGGNIIYQIPAAGSVVNKNTVAFLQLSQK